MVNLVGLALPGSRAKEDTVQNLSPQAGTALPAQTSAVVANAMGRRGRRRSQDHASQKSPPVAHSPRMGRGSCRTDGAQSICGVGDPRSTCQGRHRPKLVTPNRDRVVRPDECGCSECDGPARAPALPGSRAAEATLQDSSPQAGMALPVQMRAVVVNAIGRRGHRRSHDHASPTASPRVLRCSPSRCPGPGPGVTTRARSPHRPSGHRSCATTGVGVRSR